MGAAKKIYRFANLNEYTYTEGRRKLCLNHLR